MMTDVAGFPRNNDSFPLILMRALSFEMVANISSVGFDGIDVTANGSIDVLLMGSLWGRHGFTGKSERAQCTVERLQSSVLGLLFICTANVS